MSAPTTSSEIERHLRQLIGERSAAYPNALQQAEDYIAAEFAQHGWQVQRQPVRWEGRLFHNVIATLPGATPERLILGAHFDAVAGTPGADDNASGVAVLLEAARQLAGLRPHYTIDCVAFTLEEVGLIGSMQYLDVLRSTRARIRGMWSLEMVGYTNTAPRSQQLPAGLEGRYPSTGTFLALIANRQSQGWLRETMNAMRPLGRPPIEQLVVPENGLSLPMTRLSDHAPFWDAGLPALLLTDTAFLRNPHYHQPTDALETLNVGFMTHVCEAVATAAAALSQPPTPARAGAF